jgi:hypothetical protein
VRIPPCDAQPPAKKTIFEFFRNGQKKFVANGERASEIADNPIANEITVSMKIVKLACRDRFFTCRPVTRSPAFSLPLGRGVPLTKDDCIISEINRQANEFTHANCT